MTEEMEIRLRQELVDRKIEISQFLPGKFHARDFTSDGDDGQPQPDAIMKWGNEIEEVLGRGGRYGF